MSGAKAVQFAPQPAADLHDFGGRRPGLAPPPQIRQHHAQVGQRRGEAVFEGGRVGPRQPAVDVHGFGGGLRGICPLPQILGFIVAQAWVRWHRLVHPRCRDTSVGCRVWRVTPRCHVVTSSSWYAEYSAGLALIGSGGIPWKAAVVGWNLANPREALTLLSWQHKESLPFPGLNPGALFGTSSQYGNLGLLRRIGG